jgi:hypothetical protein
MQVKVLQECKNGTKKIAITRDIYYWLKKDEDGELALIEIGRESGVIDWDKLEKIYNSK